MMQITFKELNNVKRNNIGKHIFQRYFYLGDVNLRIRITRIAEHIIFVQDKAKNGVKILIKNTKKAFSNTLLFIQLVPHKTISAPIIMQLILTGFESVVTF